MAGGDLRVTGARLLDGRVVDVEVVDGAIASVVDAGSAPSGDVGSAPSGDVGSAPSGDTTRTDGRAVVDAGGRLVTRSFVDGHLHLEKAFTLERVGDEALAAYTAGDMGSASQAIELASAVKRDYDRSWLVPNIRRALREAIRHGTLTIQAFVDVDTTAQLEGLQAVLQVRDELADVLDVQVVAFPQDGVVRDDGAAALVEEALHLGADVVGGIPWIEFSDRDAQRHVDWACDLAVTTGRRVAMLTDDAGDPSLRTTEMLATAMIDRGLQGRGVACHARAVGTYAVPSQLRLARLARTAGLAFVSDPQTGPVHLPVQRFLDEGVDVALGQDDVEDAYYPFGRSNLLEVAFLAAHSLGMLADADQRTLIELVTTRAARVLGADDRGIAPGAPADLVVHGHERLVDVLRVHAAPQAVVSRGRVVATTSTTSQFHQVPAPVVDA